MNFLFFTSKETDNVLMEKIFKANFPKATLDFAYGLTEILSILSYESKYVSILIDVELKDTSPSTLYNDLSDIVGQKPFIFVGSPNLLKTQIDSEIFLDNELNHIIERPYNHQEIITVIKDIIDFSIQEEIKNSIKELNNDEMMPMAIRNFYLFKKMKYDVYLRLTSDQFIKIIEKNTPYKHNTINSYSKKMVKELYLFKDEYLQLLEESVLIIEGALDNTKPGQVQKSIDLQIKAVTIIHQYIRTIGITDKLTKLTEVLIHSTSKVWEFKHSLLDLIDQYPYDKKDYSEYAILTAYISHGIISGINWKSDLSKNKLVLAAILQDCMLEKDDWVKINGLSDPMFSNLSEEEKQNYLDHPIKAAKVSENFKHFPDIDFILLQHHELPNGKGFPFGIGINKFTTISTVFNISTIFVSAIMRDGKEHTNVKNIVNNLITNFMIGNFRIPVESLAKQLKSIKGVQKT